MSDFKIKNILGFTRSGKSAVEKSIKDTNILPSFLIQTPSSQGEFVHPLNSLEYQDTAYIILKNKRRWLNIIATAYAFIIPIFFLLLSTQFLPIAIIMFAFCISITVSGIIEQRTTYQNIQQLKSKANFYAKVIFNQKALLHVIIFFVAIGFFQLLFASFIHHQDDLLMKYGLILNTSQALDYYRPITASLIHSGLRHWFSNFVCLIWFGMLCYPLLGNKVIFVCLSISGLAMISLQIISLYHPLSYHGVIGLSGGVMGLAGFIVSASLFKHDQLPQQLYVGLLPSISGPFILSQGMNVSNEIHFLGLLIGGIWGMIFGKLNLQWD